MNTSSTRHDPQRHGYRSALLISLVALAAFGVTTVAQAAAVDRAATGQRPAEVAGVATTTQLIPAGFTGSRASGSAAATDPAADDATTGQSAWRYDFDAHDRH